MSDPTPAPIVAIPLDAIDPAALARDRAALDPEALEELKTSILASGLRMPIEVFVCSEPENGRTHGLISGFRRLAVFRDLHSLAHDKTRFATIPAFIRQPASYADALAAMVEENTIRADVSPWEQAMVAVTARDERVFDSIEAAIDGLYKSLARDKRYRLRNVAHLAEELDGHLTAPETLSLRQLLRLAGATSRGYADLMRHALTESRSKDPEHQWRVLLLPILAECEDPAIPDPKPAASRRDRPRRTFAFPLNHTRVRRERTREGWSLHFTGKDATGMLMDTVFDEIERLVSPE